MKEFDKEQRAFEDTLTEFPIAFPPSYPFQEKVSEPTSYMQTRCPAWCDRVLLSQTARKLISETDSVEYNLMGLSTCMGDHKVRPLISFSSETLFLPYYSLFSSIEMQPVYLDCHVLVSD